MARRVPYLYILLPILLFRVAVLPAQTPFIRKGQVFLIVQNISTLVEFSVSPLYNTLTFNTIGVLPGNFNALGFRKTDNLLYGINIGNGHLYRIDANAVAEDLGAVGLDNTLYYEAGDISPDGKTLVCIGTDGMGNTVQLAKISLEMPGTPAQFITLNSPGRIVDVAFDPFSGILYGYNDGGTNFLRIDANSGAITNFAPIDSQHKIYSLYFDAFGDLHAYGSSVYGIVDALFLVDKNAGAVNRITTGVSAQVADGASCPFSIEMKSDVDPPIILPCSPVTYTYKIANGSGETLNGLNFEQKLPPGFHLSQVIQNPFGVLLDTLSVPGSILAKNFEFQPGIKNFVIKLAVSDIPKGLYRSQGVLDQVPVLYGGTVISDNAGSPGFEDSTILKVNRFDQDSLFFRWFICHGETMVLDGSEYGGSVVWNTGATASGLSVSQGGLYSLKAGNTCENIYVEHDVTSATCPYTIKVEHSFVPDTIFACSDLIFRFIVGNDSGEKRFNLSFTDTLPDGFSFLQIKKNPMGGTLKPSLQDNIFSLEGMNLKIGSDTLDVLVHAGDVPSGIHRNRAKLYNLPLVMGPNRLSDDPSTFPFDSSELYIRGTNADTLFYDQQICSGSDLVLDASTLGVNFLWDDGSTNPKYVVSQSGDYHLLIQDGCEPSQVFYHIVQGNPVDVIPLGPFSIHQGEQIALAPDVISVAGDSIAFHWTDPLKHSLSCLDCVSTVAMPLETTEYNFQVSNGVCQDSIGIELLVDKSRRIYAPNIFSPDGDGVNDYFYLQSPDFGVMLSFIVYDRWGNVVYTSESRNMNEETSGWDGRNTGKIVLPGVYSWWAKIEFVDGERMVYRGDVTVLR